MIHQGGRRVAAACAVLFGASLGASAAPFMPHPIGGGQPMFVDAHVDKVVVFGRNSRRTVEEFARDEKLDPAKLHHKFALCRTGKEPKCNTPRSFLAQVCTLCSHDVASA